MTSVNFPHNQLRQIPDMEETFRKEKGNYKLYPTVLAIAGFAVIIWSAFKVDYRELNQSFIVFAIMTVYLSRFGTIQFPYLRLRFSDINLFVVGFLIGFEPMLMLSAVEAFLTKYPRKKDIYDLAGHIGGNVISLAVGALTSVSLFGRVTDFKGEHLTYFALLAFGIFIITVYFCKSAIYLLLKGANRSDSITIKVSEAFSWVPGSALISGSIGLSTAIALHNTSLYVVILASPILAIAYISYRSYLDKLSNLRMQAEKATQHLLEMRTSEERFRSVFGRVPTGMAIVAQDGTLVQVNQSLSKITGYLKDELIGSKFQLLLHPLDAEVFDSEIVAVFEADIESFQTEIQLFHQTGVEVWASLSVSRIIVEIDQTIQLILHIEDITERKSHQRRLIHAAHYDSLTNLANRTLLIRELETEILRASKEPNHCFALIFMDLDRFKIVNDSMGHIAGDLLLVEVAKRLSNCIPSGNLIARLSGDEFIILQRNIKNEEDITALADLIQDSISSKYDIRGKEIIINASIGISIFDESSGSFEDILREADTALHEAKAKGRGKSLIFDDQMRARVIDRMEVETDLRQAAKRNQLFLVYQPIISLSDGSLSGFEALVRWKHPVKGLINPVEFISVAEEIGEITRIGAFVLREACQQLKSWESELRLPKPLTMSVNVSPKQFASGDIMDVVLSALEESKINPSNLKLEITESAVIDNIEATTSILRKLRLLGVKISMDDFGTGYSSLNYIHQLPITTLKVDRSFVIKMGSEQDTAAIVNTIIMMAKSLGLETVAEGIDTKKQITSLRDFGCHYGQGYYFSKPLTVTEAYKYLLKPFTKSHSRTKTNKQYSELVNQLDIDSDIIELNPRNYS